MCFSASASFGAGIAIAVIGVVALKKTKSRSAKLFASIPLIFSFQQITEGFLWLSLSNSNYAFLEHFSTYTFLFIAQVVWPFWVPFSISLLEPKYKRKKILNIIAVMGAMVSVYLGVCLLIFDVKAEIIGNHIAYLQGYPENIGLVSGIIYMIATVFPPFFSKAKYMWALGSAIFISYLVTTIFYNDYIVSVWCFFASVISIIVLVIMNEYHQSKIMVD